MILWRPWLSRDLYTRTRFFLVTRFFILSVFSAAALILFILELFEKSLADDFQMGSFSWQFVLLSLDWDAIGCFISMLRSSFIFSGIWDVFRGKFWLISLIMSASVVIARFVLFSGLIVELPSRREELC